MASLKVMLTLNQLVCNETCYGPGADIISLTSNLYDTTIPKSPVLIPGTNVTIGPFEMDKASNIKPGGPAVSKIGPMPIFRNIQYSREPNPPGALPESLLLTVALIKGDARVTLINIPVTFNVFGGQVTVDIGAAIGKIAAKVVDIFVDHILGTFGHAIGPNPSLVNGIQFNDVATGAGSNYSLQYTFFAS